MSQILVSHLSKSITRMGNSLQTKRLFQMAISDLQNCLDAYIVMTSIRGRGTAVNIWGLLNIYKVRAHIGIEGNELADAVAKGDALISEDITFGMCGIPGRAAAWPRFSYEFQTLRHETSTT